MIGYDIAGEVESVGEGVTTHSVGDRVLGGTRFGGYAELVTVAEDQALPLPEDVQLRAGRRASS